MIYHDVLTRVLGAAVNGGAEFAEVFAEDNFERVLAGENRISVLSEEMRSRFLSKNIVRLHKDPQTGQGTFHAVEKDEEVIRLAGVKAHFDLSGDYGVDARITQAYDIATELAIAAAIEALRDAGIPLVRDYQETRSGKRVAKGWKLPTQLQAGTGIVFCSAFPGYSNLIEHCGATGTTVRATSTGASSSRS